MREQLCLRLLGLAAVSIVLAACGANGAHRLNVRLPVALDSVALTITNPSKRTYYQTEVTVNDAFRWHVATLAPGARRTVRLDSLRDGAGQRLPRTPRITAVWCYAQDSAGNFGAFTWYPPGQTP